MQWAVFLLARGRRRSGDGKRLDNWLWCVDSHCTRSELHRFLVVCALASDLYCPGYNPRQSLPKDSNLAHTATRYKVNTAKITTGVQAELLKKTHNHTPKKGKAPTTDSKANPKQAYEITIQRRGGALSAASLFLFLRNLLPQSCPWSWGTVTVEMHDAVFPARSEPL
jgi:hypothetical protein